MNNRIPDEQFSAAIEKHKQENREKLGKMLSDSSKSQILRSLAPDVAKPLDAPKMRGWCPNPGHKQTSGKAFRLFDNFDSSGNCICNTCGHFDGIVQTLMFVNGWDKAQTWTALYDYFDIRFKIERVFEICGRTYTGKSPAKSESSVPVPRVYEPAKSFEPKNLEEHREKLKKAASKLSNTEDDMARQIIKTYLESRGIPGDIGIKYLGKFAFMNLSDDYWYVDDNKKPQKYVVFPTLYMKILTPDGKAASFHRHYLQPKGKGGAVLEPRGNAELPKKKGMVYCEPSNGCYMPVGYGPKCNYPVMGVGEGLETTLSGAVICGIPSRAASAGMLDTIHIPDHVEVVVHFCDPDDAGINSGNELEARCKELGKQYIREIPPVVPSMKGPDWNDVLKHFGLNKSRQFMKFLTESHQLKSM